MECDLVLETLKCQTCTPIGWDRTGVQIGGTWLQLMYYTLPVVNSLISN